MKVENRTPYFVLSHERSSSFFLASWLKVINMIDWFEEFLLISGAIYIIFGLISFLLENFTLFWLFMGLFICNAYIDRENEKGKKP